MGAKPLRWGLRFHTLYLVGRISCLVFVRGITLQGHQIVIQKRLKVRTLPMMGYLLEALPYKHLSYFSKNESHYASILMGYSSIVFRGLHPVMITHD